MASSTLSADQWSVDETRCMTECACENPDRLMSIASWCLYWGINESFARKLIRTGQIERVRLGRRIYLTKSEGNAVIARNTLVAPTRHSG